MSVEKKIHPQLCKSCGKFHAPPQGKKSGVSDYPAPLKKLIQADNNLRNATKPRNDANREATLRTSYAAVVYSENPDPLLAFVDNARTLSVALKRITSEQDDQKKYNPKFLEGCKRVDIFSTPIRGRSMLDIEQMGLSLSKKASQLYLIQ